VLLTTDGITEARDISPEAQPGQEGEFLGYAGMIELARKHAAGASVRDLGRAILEGARAFGGIFRDDACLLLARRR